MSNPSPAAPWIEALEQFCLENEQRAYIGTVGGNARAEAFREVRGFLRDPTAVFPLCALTAEAFKTGAACEVRGTCVDAARCIGHCHVQVIPDLDRAWRAVDACGGSYPPADHESGYARGHSEALTAACAEIEKLGGRPS